MSFEVTLKQLVERYQTLEQQLVDPTALGSEYAKLSKEYADLAPLVQTIEQWFKAKQEKQELEDMLKDPKTDPEMKALAEDELPEQKRALKLLDKALQVALLPKDEADEKNVILEIRAGTGGDEAALFAAELFRMYQRYAALHGWKVEIMSIDDTGIGGYKEATASIAGNNVYARMKFESGVHRVQRVPETESGGRIHTSAATVAVLPEAEDIDIHIEDKDLRIDVFRSSGPGGQSVNTTDSAVRIVHLPTGITVQQQDEKSQHKNRAKAMKILRARLYEAERERQAKERSDSRKSQVGSGDRSERIRTYNFPQGRVSDHRINLTLYKIHEIVNEGALDEIIDALVAENQAQQLANHSS